MHTNMRARTTSREPHRILRGIWLRWRLFRDLPKLAAKALLSRELMRELEACHEGVSHATTLVELDDLLCDGTIEAEKAAVHVLRRHVLAHFLVRKVNVWQLAA